MFLCGTARAEPMAYTDETEFQAALAALGVSSVSESFEDDLAWGQVRSGTTAATVVSQGVEWSSNFSAGGITTGPGPALSGNYGFYAIPHGSYATPEPGSDCLVPGECGDGFRGVALSRRLVAIGGWLDTNTPPAKIGLFLGDYPNNPVGFGETCDPPDSENCVSNSSIGTPAKFFGVIDTAGFDRFEFRELEGKLEIDGGDIKLIFADDFSFAFMLEDLFRNGFE